MYRQELLRLLALLLQPPDIGERLVTRAGPRLNLTCDGCRYCVPVGNGGQEVTVAADPW